MRFRNTTGFISILLLTSFSASLEAHGNRYFSDRVYHSEISAAEACQELNSREDRHSMQGDHTGKALLIDVRSLEEFAVGHPVRSYNVPYPRVCSGCAEQSDANFDIAGSYSINNIKTG